MIIFLLYYMITMFIAYRCVGSDGYGYSNQEILTLYFFSFIIIPVAFIDTLFDNIIKE